MLISYQFVQFRLLLLICSVKKLKFTILKNSAPIPTIIRVSRIGVFAHEARENQTFIGACTNALWVVKQEVV